MNRYEEKTPLSASNLNEIIFQLEHNTVLGGINNAKQRFWEVVLVDLLINNNDRNEDNWGVIKNKKNNTYRLSPIYDCGNCFYGKTSDERIAEIMSDENKLLSSAINGITAYEDDNEKRIRNEDIVKINNDDLKKALARIESLYHQKHDEIIKFIVSIPESFMGVNVMSDIKKRYYIKTFELRFETILSSKVNQDK